MQENSLMEVTTESDNKARKTVQITFNISGVESASLVSSDKNQIVVSGEGTNSDKLSFSIGIKIDFTATTDSGEINTGGGTGMDDSEISRGGGGKSHDVMT
ncbi:uncharacterized protein LOC143562459 [Bidens hawaiensis]|uniref:uncharacterized protein LOC143562459 n=1 Tax=Bidens hawaiensis TaxID=980011 RepID=UPI004049D7A7